MQEPPSLKPTGLKPHDETSATKSGKSSGFVFGANLADRVVPQSSTTAFQTPIKSNSDSDDDKLKASSLKRKFDAITGEECEQTVLQAPVKLFVWNLSSSTWAEKGRGVLKLNDPKKDNTTKEKDSKSGDADDHDDTKRDQLKVVEDIHDNAKKDQTTGDADCRVDAKKDETQNKMTEFPRLIMRITGTLRIILNVSINPEHFKIIGTYEDDKSQVFRFSDSRELYAVSGSAKEMVVLRRAVEWRLQNETSKLKKTDQCLHPTSITESKMITSKRTSLEKDSPEESPPEETTPEKSSPTETAPEKSLTTEITSGKSTPIESSTEKNSPEKNPSEKNSLEITSPEQTSSLKT